MIVFATLLSWVCSQIKSGRSAQLYLAGYTRQISIRQRCTNNLSVW